MYTRMSQGVSYFVLKKSNQNDNTEVARGVKATGSRYLLRVLCIRYWSRRRAFVCNAPLFSKLNL